MLFRSWQLMSVVNDYKSPDQSTAIELQFVPNLTNGVPSGVLSYTENSVNYPLGGKFKYFSVKLVLLSNDPTVTPILQNARIIALPAG